LFSFLGDDRGNGKVVQMLLNAGVDIDTYGGVYGSALQIASGIHNEQVVQTLLDAGPDVDTQGV
jgi:hypothetical protein